MDDDDDEDDDDDDENEMENMQIEPLGEIIIMNQIMNACFLVIQIVQLYI